MCLGALIEMNVRAVLLCIFGYLNLSAIKFIAHEAQYFKFSLPNAGNSQNVLQWLMTWWQLAVVFFPS